MSALPLGVGAPASAPLVPCQPVPRGPNWMKLYRDLAIVKREARYVVRIKADDSVTVRKNKSGRLNVIAILNAAGMLAAEIAFHRQSPYAAIVDRKGETPVSVQNRRPKATLSPDEVALVAPVIARVIRAHVDAVVREWDTVQLRLRLPSAWIVRDRAKPVSWQRYKHIVNGTFWKVATRDEHLLAAVERQTLAPFTGLSNALDCAARALVRIVTHHKASYSRHRTKKIKDFFKLQPNDRWKNDDAMLLEIVRRYARARGTSSAALARQYAQQVLNELLLAGIICEELHEELWKAYCADPSPVVRLAFGDLYIRHRPQSKQYRGKQRIFVVLPSESLWGDSLDYRKIEYKRGVVAKARAATTH